MNTVLSMQTAQFWNLYKADKPSCDIVMRTSAGLVYLLACLLEPFIPSFSLEVNILTTFLLALERKQLVDYCVHYKSYVLIQITILW